MTLLIFICGVAAVTFVVRNGGHPATVQTIAVLTVVAIALQTANQAWEALQKRRTAEAHGDVWDDDAKPDRPVDPAVSPEAAVIRAEIQAARHDKARRDGDDHAGDKP